MNYIKYLFLLFATTSCEKIIKNIKIDTIKDVNYPSCRNCVYYKPSPFTSDYGSSISKCEKIGVKNVITGKIIYNYVDSCRNDELKCGKEGKYFVEERNLNLKIFTHVFISSIPNTILVSLLVLEFINILKYNEIK
jgi:hypothetical protein